MFSLEKSVFMPLSSLLLSFEEEGMLEAYSMSATRKSGRLALSPVAPLD